MAINKRRHVRTPVHFSALPPAKMTLFKPFYHEPFDVEILDLSAGGMKITSPEILPLFFEFGLEFQLPNTELIRANAKALHQVRNDNSYDVGVVFTEIEEPIRESLQAMGTDYGSCEERIRRAEEDVCRENCRFMTLCLKTQKKRFP